MSQLQYVRRGAWRSLLESVPIIAGLLITVIPAAGCDLFDPGDDRRPRPAGIGPELAVEWSELAYEIAYAEDQFLTYKGQRALALMHLAMHDALQAVIPVYAAYVYEAAQPDADPLAAAAQAAYAVMIANYPDRSADLDALLARWLDSVPSPEGRTLGVALGSASAQAILAHRDDDDWDLPGEYEQRPGPGHYQTTPPWDGFVLQPGFRYARPFSFDDVAQFRPPPPPALDSPAYAEALNEVRLRGDSASTLRTEDETGYALWWMEFSESGVGRVARALLRERDVDLWDANRVLAHMYVSLYDGYVTNWDSKFEYNHWRPYTAIRAAGEDGNAGTSADPDWVSLRPAPPFPEYASAHATGCAAAFEVLAEAFGDTTAFENTSLTAPPGMPTRSFPGFRAAAAECADSRVQLGWHYRYAIDAGAETGRRIARHVMATLLLPR